MRFPVRRQLELTDCGPVCIQIIAAYYGKNIPLSQLREYCNVTGIGISIQDLLTGCKRIGFDSVAAHVNINEIGRMPLPAILFWRQEHFVVLYKIKKRKGTRYFYIVDPSFGKACLPETDFLQDWTEDNFQGVVCVIEPTEDFFSMHKRGRTKEIIKETLRPFRFLIKYKKHIYTALFFSVITIVCAWFIPFVLQRIIDKGIGNKDLHLIVLLLLAQVGLFIGNLISNFLSNTILFKTGLQIGLDITTSYIIKLTRLPISFFDTKLGTDLLQRLNDEDKIKTFLTYTVNNIVLMGLNFLVYSSILLYYNASIFLIFIFFVSLTIIIAKITLIKRKLINYSLFTKYSEKRNVEFELTVGMMEIKTNNAHKLFTDKWENIQQKINSLSIKNLYLEYCLGSGTSFLNILRDIVITGSCAYLVINGQMTLGIMMTITYVLGSLSGTVTQVTGFIKGYQDSKLSYERIEEIQKVQEENDKCDITLADSTRIESGFFLENLSFKYTGTFNPYVLNNISVKIPVNRVTAIVGASGSGKTTLMKLLLSFYYPQKGNLYLDGQKMFRIDTNEWHKRCGVVMQDGFIFSGTIAKNIALHEEKPDLKRLEEAAKIACIDVFINRLPMKYNTKIGNAGIDLSGGQRQRILIARAVYRNPDFIFFDEATSSLDANNEQKIMNNLRKFYKGKTVVIIAHRLSTVKDADNIIVLDKGRLAEEGTHDSLVCQKGIYYCLVKNQLELGH